MIKAPKFSFWGAVAAVLLAAGGYAAVMRFVSGLGATTNLSDMFPWGLWIAFDVLVGVGLAAGGFTIAATVHIFKMEKYESIARPSLLTAFLGYLLVTVALVFDIGRPFRLWHPLIMWNPHSVMFEVAWCVTLYTTVLALEFSPIVFERLHMNVPLRLVRAIYLPLVIAGVLLSTLHQSSLGTVFLIVPDKLNGLWYTPLLPVFFFLTAVTAGLAMTIVESFLSARAFGKHLEHEVLTGLAHVIAVLLAVYFVWKFLDLNQRGMLSLAFTYNSYAVLFWTEVGAGVLIPMIILFLLGDGIKENTLFFCALLVVLGFTLNRLNVSITAMSNSETYFPKWTELAVTLALVAAGFVIFRFAVLYLPIFPGELKTASSVSPVSPLSGRLVAMLWGIALVSGAAYALAPSTVNSTVPPSWTGERSIDPEGGSLTALPRDIVLNSDESPGEVTFSHHDHVGNQDRPECGACHPGLFSFKLSGTPSLPPGQWHNACGSCHNGKEASGIKDNCQNCHAEE